MGQRLRDWVNSYLGEWYMPDVRITDILEIIIIAFLVYQIMVWIKNTKAWMLLKGIIVLVAFILVAALLKMNTILWIAEKSISVLATAALVVFQPELRRALEKLGQKNFFSSMLTFERNRDILRYSENTIRSIVDACYEMSKAKTGALIVVEQEIMLSEYQITGIALDCLVCEMIELLLLPVICLYQKIEILVNN